VHEERYLEVQKLLSEQRKIEALLLIYKMLDQYLDISGKKHLEKD
jgi:hypothetical protein